MGSIGPALTVRIAGLPPSAMDVLQTPCSAAAASDLARRERELRKESEALSGLLHTIIGDLGLEPERRSMKPRLVGLRRAVHQLRAPGRREWSEDLCRCLPSDYVDRHERWVLALAAWREDRRELPKVVSADLAHVASGLRHQVSEPDLRRAWSLVSPSLFADVARWSRDSQRALDRKLLVRLTRYVSRTAVKTSPQSTLTGSGMARWSTTERQPVRLRVGSERRAVLELSASVLSELVDGIARRPEVWDDLVVRVNPSLTRRGGELTVLGHGPAEPIVTLPARAAITRLLDLAGDGPTVSILRERVAPDDDRFDDFLRQLAEIGLVELGPPLGTDPSGVLGDVADWLRRTVPLGLAGVTSPMEQIRVQIEAPAPFADVEAIERQHHAVRTAVAELRRCFREPHADQGPAGGESRRLLYDNCVYAEPVATCSWSQWRPVLADLDTTRRWLAIFNPALPVRLALGPFFREQFHRGAAVPLLDLHRAVHQRATSAVGEELMRHLQWRGHEPTLLSRSVVPRIRQLRELQVAAISPFTSPAGSDEVVHVNPAALEHLAAEWPPWVAPLASMTCYLQPVVEDDRLQVVLNRTSTGHGRGINRVTHLLARAGVSPPAREIEGDPDDGAPVTAEVSGLFGTGLNNTSPCASSAIRYPFARRGWRSGDDLPLGDLVAVHDPDQDLVTLRSQRLDREVRPIQGGLMDGRYLPPAATTVMQAFGSGPPPSPGLLLWDLGRDPAAADCIVETPRVEAGSVILRRRSWWVPDGEVPRRDRGDDDATHLLRVTSWRQAHRLPEKVFTRVFRQPMDKHRKPMALDFSSLPLILAWEGATRETATGVYLEEALPDPARGSRRVCEFVVDISEGVAGER